MGAKDVGVVLGIVAVLLLLIAACYVVIAPRLDPARLAQDELRHQIALENLRLEQERERQRTAAVLATLRMQELAARTQATVDASASVVRARVVTATLLSLWLPLSLSASVLAGAGVLCYAALRRVAFEAAGIKTFVTRHQAAVLAERALYVAGLTEESKTAMLQEQISQARFAQGVSLFHALKTAFKSNGALPATPPLAVAAPELPTPSFAAPTFAALFAAGELGEGKPLLMGFSQDGQPQRRAMEDIKALSVAGQQGAGKTASMAYLITSTLLLSSDAEEYIIDPHWKHPKGLGAMIAPLTATGRVHLINPVDMETTIDTLNARLDRRLAGAESSDAPILFCVDELAKMGKSPLFAEKLLPFVERFTEETRKAGMIGVFGSQKWNARHFGNKADIRATIPSLLIHRIKPSQADLLLEDRENLKLMKRVNLPGQALMATSHDADPSVITVPLITRRDIEQIARILCGATTQAGAGSAETMPPRVDLTKSDDAPERNVSAESVEPTEPPQSAGEPKQFDAKATRERFGVTQARFAELTGVSLPKLKKVETRAATFTPAEITQIFTRLRTVEPPQSAGEPRS